MRDIESTLRSLGITRLYKGYKQLHYAINIVVSNNDDQKLVIRHIFEEVAALTNCKWNAIERNIRTLSAHAWKINPSFLSEMAGHPLSSAPSASELIEIISTYVSAEI